MKDTNQATSKAALLAATSALVILLAGCQSAVKAPAVTYTSNPAPNQTYLEDEPDSPQKTYIEQTENEPHAEEPHRNSADTTTDGTAETSNVRKTDDSTKGIVKTEGEDSAWSSAKPKLHGISIGESSSIVEKLHGKPVDTYNLDEEIDLIQVYEYDGFAIGINSKQKVQYVEVYDKRIKAGLSGLKVGDKPDAALHLLGKPDKQTTYLLTYESTGALLKLDLDPDHNKIVSIKLLTLN